ncbi:M-phase-specific PLK1-interacting protein [Tachysurus fulvidraco]|uniref:M-phase-specific PLK1-interacting protein n=1 Tax=Tachysurus fulvidraco TaxID=1234273 RepID=UPI000F4D5379|nr:M-phase-specific PLK1-interacting protein [Tachysurus fulvidraco]
MQRPHFRAPYPAAGSRGGGFRTPPPALDRAGGGRFPSPPWAFPNGPYGPRFGSYGGSPVSHTSPREFSSNRGGIYHTKSAGHTPYRPNSSPTSRHSPYQSPGAHSRYQGSPRTSTPHDRDRGTNNMDKYYKASMLQDPWANLQPVSVTQTQSKCSFQQATHTGSTGRYYNKN